MNIFKKKQPKERIKSIERLESFLNNTGRFSILVLGHRGTGKKFWIYKKYMGKLVLHRVNAAVVETSKTYWESQFKKANHGILIVDDVDQLSKANQEILFDGLATTSGDGKYGYESKEYEIRVVFTSIKDIALLRDTEQYLSHKFFDRIAQLVVKFPSFKDSSSNIKKDLQATWDKFKFNTVYPILLEEWLEKQNYEKVLHGNFRDLDKLCINWNNYQLMEIEESKILDYIINDFNDYYHFPEPKYEGVFDFTFSKDISYHETLHAFKVKYKKWAKKEYGTLKAASEALNVSRRTMEGWK